MGQKRLCTLRKLFSSIISAMLKAVLFACWLVVVVASPRDTIIKVDQEHHKHDQKGIPGKSVTGSYQFVAADGAIHVITYVADERGYRVIGDAKLEDTRPSTQPYCAPSQQSFGILLSTTFHRLPSTNRQFWQFLLG